MTMVRRPPVLKRLLVGCLVRSDRAASLAVGQADRVADVRFGPNMTDALAVSSGSTTSAPRCPVRGRTPGLPITVVAVLTAMNLRWGAGVRFRVRDPTTWMCREAGRLTCSGRLGGTVACGHGRGYVVVGVPGSLVGEHEEADHGGNAVPGIAFNECNSPFCTVRADASALSTLHGLTSAVGWTVSGGPLGSCRLRGLGSFRGLGGCCCDAVHGLAVHA